MILQSFLFGLALAIVIGSLLTFALFVLSSIFCGFTLMNRGVLGSGQIGIEILRLAVLMLAMISLFGKAEILLESAEKQVAEQERIPQGSPGGFILPTAKP